MTFQLILRSSVPPSASPYRLLDGKGRELVWANAFLDAQRLRQLSLRSLRAYGYDLLHLALAAFHATPARQDQSIAPARLCPLPTRSAAQARAFHCQSSSRRAGLSLSFPLRMRDSWQQSPFSS